jgi:Uma2 family endonuclease
MTTTSDREPMTTPANGMPGPGQGHWTYKDYLALPDDGSRYEIVNGVLYMTPSPSGAHQDAVLEIAAYLRDFVKHAGLGKVRVAPFDVELAHNVVVQPDILVVLNDHRDRIEESRIAGAPDLVVEVSSPGTSTYDRNTKYHAYARAGVIEYWIADPIAQTVEVLVLDFNNYQYQSLGVFRGKAVLSSQVLPGFPSQVEQFFS